MSDVFLCQHCGKAFDQKWKLTQHNKNYHPIDQTELQCTHCKKTFTTTASKTKHEGICRACVFIFNINNYVFFIHKCFAYHLVVDVIHTPEPVNVDKTIDNISQRHSYKRSTLDDNCSALVSKFQTWLEQGMSYLTSHAHKALAPTSISSYISHCRSYLSWFLVYDKDIIITK